MMDNIEKIAGEIQEFSPGELAVAGQ